MCPEQVGSTGVRIRYREPFLVSGLELSKLLHIKYINKTLN